VRLQQNSTVVVDQMAQRRIEALLCAIYQSGTIIAVHLRHLVKMVLSVCKSAAIHQSVGEYLDDLL